MKNIYSEDRLRSGCLHGQILSYSFSFFPRFRATCESYTLKQITEILTEIEKHLLYQVIALESCSIQWFQSQHALVRLSSCKLQALFITSFCKLQPTSHFFIREQQNQQQPLQSLCEGEYIQIGFTKYLTAKSLDTLTMLTNFTKYQIRKLLLL